MRASCGRCEVSERQAKAEGAAVARLTRDSNLAALPLDELASDVEPQSKAGFPATLDRSLRLKVCLPNLRLLVRGEARLKVLDPDARGAFFACFQGEIDADWLGLGRELELLGAPG
jgi:hypothetical protein